MLRLPDRLVSEEVCLPPHMLAGSDRAIPEEDEVLLDASAQQSVWHRWTAVSDLSHRESTQAN